MGWTAFPLNASIDHDNHRPSDGYGVDSPGIFVFPSLLDMLGAGKVVENLEKTSWSASQSGKRNQNFGPAVNFKEMKITVGDFVEFPRYAKFLHERLHSFPSLENFCPIEQCVLECDPVKGASIVPHIDDCWVWGDRVLTVNCCGESVLTLTKYKGDCNRYNLKSASNEYVTAGSYHTDIKHDWNDVVIRVLMPEFSLVVLQGPARYQFEHSVLPEDVLERRICLTFREFSPPFKFEGG